MADWLTATQAAAFAGPNFDWTKLQLKGELISPTPSTIDVTARVNSFGRLRLELYNVSPGARGRFEHPRMTWTVINDDGYFTEGHAGAVWGSNRPQAFRMRYTAREIITGSANDLLELDFNVLEVETQDETATIIGIHRLSRYWAKRWERDERHAADWATHSVSHGVTL